mmetsp:Transcript_17356/g.54560  ORF Transcript_17356/g.54560 Transcript_17356/m.54560 type:complete len:134 (+) Transcript_17356:117-518(+)
MPEEEEAKKTYDVPLIRLQDSTTTLNTEDLDEEERKALAEVSRRGYYHARPKTEPAPPPRRIEGSEAEALQWSTKSSTTRKRTTFDKYQQKWDKFDKQEPVVQEVDAREEGKAAAETEGRSPGLPGLCCRRRR